MTHQQHDNTDELLDQATAALRQTPVPPGPPAQVLARVLDLPAARTGAMRFHSLRRPLPSLIAAVLTIATAGLLIYAVLGQTPAVAWADVLEKVSRTRTLTCTLDEPDAKGDQAARLLLKDGWLRLESRDGQVVVWSQSTGRQLMLDPVKRKAIAMQMAEQPLDLYGWIRDFRQGGQSKPLGQKMLAGRQVEGFEVTRANPMFPGKSERWIVWADPRTELPVQIEIHGPGDRNAAATLRDFRFDVPLEDKLFDLSVPAGYALNDMGGIPTSQLRPPPTTQEAAGVVLTPLVGIGPLKFGSTKDQIIQRLGQPDQVSGKGIGLEYYSKGFGLLVHPRVGLHSITCYTRAGVGPFAVNDFAGRTDKGIAMGATRPQIEAAYGKPAKVTAQGTMMVLEYPDLKAAFTLLDGRLCRIFLSGPRPQR